MNTVYIKTLAVVFLVGGANLCAAQETSAGSTVSYEDNLLETLHYRVEQHKYYGSANVVTRLNESETASQNGVATSNYSRTSWASTLDAEYGVNDNFQVGIAMNYLFNLNTQRTAEPSGTGTSYSSSGLSDPTLHFNYRYCGGLTGKHFASAYVNVTPAFGSHQNADVNTSGNNVSASSNITVGTNIYWVSGAHEWAVEPAIQYYSSGNNIDSNSNNSSNVDARYTYNLQGVYRFHFLQKYYVGANLNFIGHNATHYSFDNRNPVLTQITSTQAYFEPTLTLGWKAANNLIVYGQYQYNSFNQYNTPSTGNVTNYTDNESLLSVTAAMAF